MVQSQSVKTSTTPTQKENKSKGQEIQHGALPHIGLTFKIRMECDVGSNRVPLDQSTSRGALI